MISIFRLFSFVLWASTVFAQTGLMSTVRFRVTDVFGEPLPYRVESFVLRITGRDYADHFSGMIGTKIPFGAYKSVLRRPGPAGHNLEILRVVSVDSPEHLVALTTDKEPQPLIEPSYGPWRRYRGKITPAPLLGQGETAVVRLASVFGLAVYDAPVGETGEFSFYDWLEGDFTLTIVAGKRILHSQLVSIEDKWRSDDIVVALPNAPPPVQRITQPKGDIR